MTKKIAAGPTTKERILTTLEAGYGITVAAKQAGVTVGQFKKMISADEEFTAAADAAQVDGLVRIRDEAVIIMRKCATGEIASSVKLQAAQRLLDYAERELSARQHDTDADTSEHDFESEWAQKLSSRKQIEKT